MQPDETPTKSALHAAMKMADLIRSSLNQTSNSSVPKDEKAADFRMTPGVLEGIATGVATLLVLTPVRSLILKAAGNRLGMLPDLIATTSQIMISADVALYYGSLYGSYHYLQTFTQIPAKAVSPTVDSICRQSVHDFDSFYDEARQYTTTSSSSPSSWNPNVIVLAEFAQAMKLCHERSALSVSQEAATNKQELMDGKISWWRKDN